MEWILLWLLYLTLKPDFQKSSQTLGKPIVKKIVDKSVIIRRPFFFVSLSKYFKMTNYLERMIGLLALLCEKIISFEPEME